MWPLVNLLKNPGDAWSIHVFFPKTKQIANPKFNLHLYFFAAEVKMLNEIKQTYNQNYWNMSKTNPVANNIAVQGKPSFSWNNSTFVNCFCSGCKWRSLSWTPLIHWLPISRSFRYCLLQVVLILTFYMVKISSFTLSRRVALDKLSNAFEWYPPWIFTPIVSADLLCIHSASKRANYA